MTLKEHAIISIDWFGRYYIDDELVTDKTLSKHLSEFLKKPLPEEPKYSIVKDDNMDVYINGILIQEDVFNQDMVLYAVVEPDDEAEEIRRYYSEAKSESDKILMKDDIEYLDSLSDEYVFSSKETKDYIAFNDNPTRFNEICEEFLEVNRALTIANNKK